MSTSVKIILAIVIVLVAIQFIRPEKNQTDQPQPSDIFLAYNAPAEVKTIVKEACYDCHSNNTRYPWYNNIQPVTWWLNHHVSEGKRELNFSEFASYSPKKAAHKMDEAAEQVEREEMPLKSYKIVHAGSRLTDQQRKLLVNWFHQIQTSEEAKM